MVRIARVAQFTETPDMTKTYAQLMKQIETLNQEAEKLKRKEIDGVISRTVPSSSFSETS